MAPKGPWAAGDHRSSPTSKLHRQVENFPESDAPSNLFSALSGLGGYPAQYLVDRTFGKPGGLGKIALSGHRIAG